MIFLQILLATQLSFGAEKIAPVQADIDQAFAMIFQTQTGRAICRDILGSDASAISLHLGVSVERASKLSSSCGSAAPSDWIVPTQPADIRKIAAGDAQPHHYVFRKATRDFPIESWTDPFTNATTILIGKDGIEFNRLVQILAHETAVYFDSKTNPMLPGSENIPHLKALSLTSPNGMNPLIAVSDPMVAHTLTYLRALQVEFNIMTELDKSGLVEAPADLKRSDLLYLVNQCDHACVENLILKLRKEFLPYADPLLAFSSHYRDIVIDEIARVVPAKLLTTERWLTALSKLDSDSLQYFRTNSTGDAIQDLSMIFPGEKLPEDHSVDPIWELEWPAISQSRFSASGQSFLEFMKRPLLSGYNISISSGPRVFIRVGIIE